MIEVQSFYLANTFQSSCAIIMSTFTHKYANKHTHCQYEIKSERKHAKKSEKNQMSIKFIFIWILNCCIFVFSFFFLVCSSFVVLFVSTTNILYANCLFFFFFLFKLQNQSVTANTVQTLNEDVRTCYNCSTFLTIRQLIKGTNDENTIYCQNDNK